MDLGELWKTIGQKKWSGLSAMVAIGFVVGETLQGVTALVGAGDLRDLRDTVKEMSGELTQLSQNVVKVATTVEANSHTLDKHDGKFEMLYSQIQAAKSSADAAAQSDKNTSDRLERFSTAFRELRSRTDALESGQAALRSYRIPLGRGGGS